MIEKLVENLQQGKIEKIIISSIFYQVHFIDIGYTLQDDILSIMSNINNNWVHLNNDRIAHVSYFYNNKVVVVTMKEVK